MAQGMSLGAEWWPYLVIAVAGFLATEIWRWLGVAAARKVDETSELLRWVRAVSTALVAGLVARIVIFPVGAMALAPLPGRLGALAVGLAAYLLLGRNVFLGIIAGLGVLIATTVLATGGL